MENDVKTYDGVLQKGQGSWGEWGITIGPETGNVPTYSVDKEADPFAQGRTIQKNIGYEINWDLLKKALWEDRFLVSIAVLSGVVVGSAIYDPQKYSPLVDAFGRLISGSLQGIGEVIPG